MHIGAVAEQSGVPTKTIRYYESIGLIRQAQRTGAGYRVYGERDILTLRFIQHARGLGFSVSDVAGLLDLWQDAHRTSARVKALAKSHRDKVDRKIAELHGMRAALDHLIARCHGDERPECPILDDLAGAPSGP